MKVYFEGEGELFTNPDPDIARKHFRKKNKTLVDKRMKIEDAIGKFVKDGEYIAIGGFGGVRVPTALMHEILRQGKKELGLSGHTATHDFQILAAGECFNRCDIAYIIGLEARGISSNARKYMESGKVKTTEWTNAGMAWRFKAAALGIPFLLGRQSLGSDGIKWSASKVIECPYTSKKYATFPALYPDVALIHVHEADKYGNATIRGVSIADHDLARAAKHVVISCERIVDTEEFRNDPHKVMIPYFCVDAVCEIPHGCYPGNMPFEYFSDEDHLKEWLTVERDPEKFKAFLDKNIFSCKNFNEYLEKNGGLDKMQELRKKEFLEE
ncbi:MAG: CoA transferase subunit A [Deltaproteobacteria bacterium]|jgi:glutaconate CoA-transferase, subunit A|nr:CoA transferase subunit A [Deltaproteobacteria bacterium]